jgi:hypothetical protein
MRLIDRAWRRQIESTPPPAGAGTARHCYN